MLKAILSLGKYQYEDEIKSFIGFQSSNKIIFIDFEFSNRKLEYQGIHDEDYDKSKEIDYLYKIDTGNQYTFSLTDKISTIEKSISRLTYWFKKFEEYKNDSFLDVLEKSFKNNKEKIIEDIHSIYDVYDKSNKKNCLLSFKILENEESKYLGNYEIFNKIFKEACINEFWVPKTPKVNGVCYLCNNEREIARPREPFNFYSINKLGFAYSLDETQTWKQLAICSKCALELSAGKRFLEQYLVKNMYGNKFFLIPTPVHSNKKIMMRIIEEIKYHESEKRYQHLLCEDDLLELMKEFGTSITLSFVFYQASQGRNIIITRYVEDVTPSWINSLFKHFKKTSKKSIFSQESLQSIFGNEWSGKFLKGKLVKSKYYFLNNLGGLVRKFFPNSKKETGVYDHYFVDFIASILEKKPINEKILLRAFVRELRNKFRRNKTFDAKLYALGSLYLLLFLTEIKLFGFDKKMTSEKNIILESERTEEIEDFFKEFKNTFNSSSKKAIFSEGVLTSFLLDLQRIKRDGSEPFRSKLNGLRLDERRVKNLLPSIIEKLREYNAGYYFWLEELISKYFIQSETEGWELTKNEISYYFTLGLSIGRIFKKKKGEKENDTE